jgi:hypothetical protein
MRALLSLLAAAILAACSVNVEGAACAAPGTTDGCPSGQACGTDKTCSVAAASCPVVGAAIGQGCSPAAATSCAGTKLLHCAPAASGAPCNLWAQQEDCAAAGLACEPAGGAACACPALAGPPYLRQADPSPPPRAGLVPNGAPAGGCRFTTLAPALAASAAGDTVEATGFAGTTVVFTEDALTVPDGVTLKTSDATPSTNSYLLQPSASVAGSTFLTLRPGASISGLEVRNTSATGVGLATSCAGTGDTAAVTVDTVKVTGLGAGAPPARFANGVRHSGNCSLALTNSTITGADDTGVLLTNVAASTTLTMTGNVIQLNQANVTPYSIGPASRHGGGLVFSGATHAGTVTFQRNLLSSNAGDQVLVFTAGTLDLSPTSQSCADANTFACYGPAGAGISARFSTNVFVGYTAWSVDFPTAGIDFFADSGVTIAGWQTQQCARYTAACP